MSMSMAGTRRLRDFDTHDARHDWALLPHAAWSLGFSAQFFIVHCPLFVYPLRYALRTLFSLV